MTPNTPHYTRYSVTETTTNRATRNARNGGLEVTAATATATVRATNRPHAAPQPPHIIRDGEVTR